MARELPTSFFLVLLPASHDWWAIQDIRVSAVEANIFIREVNATYVVRTNIVRWQRRRYVHDECMEVKTTKCLFI